MTKYRRAVNVVEDLKTLGVITDDQVGGCKCSKEVIIIITSIPKNSNNYLLVKKFFKEEFLNDVTIIENSKHIKFIVN